MADLEKVRVRDCPTGLHNGEGDWVAIAPTLSLEGGLEAEDELRQVNTMATSADERGRLLQRRWAVTFVRHGVRDWNFHDEENEPIPFDADAILADFGIARLVADKAADLYTEAVLRPFQVLLATRSPTGRTTATTSKAPRQTRKRSGPSSPGTTADSAQ